MSVESLIVATRAATSFMPVVSNLEQNSVANGVINYVQFAAVFPFTQLTPQCTTYSYNTEMKLKLCDGYCH